MSEINRPTRIHTLRPDDAAAVDAILDARVRGQAPAPSTAADRRIAQLLATLAACPVEEPSADLVQRTLQRVTDYEQRQRLAMQIQSLAGPSVVFRWRELVAVAAMLLIGLSVLFPMLNRSREDARRIACQGRQAAAGYALGSYATDHNGSLPRQPLASWNSVALMPATPEQPSISNSANLYLLVREGYIDPATLACPSNPHTPTGMTARMVDWPTPAAVPFSYQNQAGSTAKVERIPTVVILADRNPLFVADPNRPQMVVFRKDAPLTSSSYLHGRKGQNTLTASGAVLWREDPVLPNNDNIWLANGITEYTGRETPADESDSFLVP